MTDAAPPRRAKLELLVRRDDDEHGFDIRTVGSAAAWVKMRPQRVPTDHFELAEVTSRVDRQRTFILKNTQTERFLMLAEPERFLWDQMDGRASVQDIATAYVLRYGQFDFEMIPGLIKKLQRAQLLSLTPASRLRYTLARHRERRLLRATETALTALERVNISSRRVQPFFNRAYRWGGGFLFTPAAVVVCLLAAVAGLVAGGKLWRETDVAAGFGAHPLLAILIVKLLFILTLAAHQIVHGLALVHYGRRVREFGFTFLHGFLPTFYVDVTDIFMASRRARVVTAVSGTLVHLVFGSLWLVLALRAANGGFVQAFAAASGILQWQAFVLALYPFCFVEMDGYHILVDVLGVPTLKHDAMAYVKSLFRGGRAPVSRREACLWLGYVVLSIVSIAAFLAFNVWVVIHATS